ncbi:MAG: epoxyqueuosine reductase QueH [Endomicrobium sp.]|jgi:predicted adenine nucleotide alpha hydrolase (AANH) superfamily ATPase|nr:epoxyqueuosine reductase QueH [Endomicrobium sp.]
MKKKLLLHICCAPCSASAVKMLKEEFDISFYWHNPNIYDKEEYIKRKEAAIRYASGLGVPFFEEKDFSYDYGGWKTRGSEQCGNCYRLRLDKAASFAKSNGFDFFSTSLLSSPYQKHDLIKQIAGELSEKHSAAFLYKDFRTEFYEGKNSLRQAGYYVQKYCGCAKSLEERYGKKQNSGE